MCRGRIDTGMKFVVIIPARYASTRFPGKPLAMIGDRPVIWHVYEQARKVVGDVVVATDDERIYNAVKAFGGRVVMTSDKHRTGTDRCFEALRKLGGAYDVVINLQGDEPFIDPSQITALMRCFEREETDIATLVKPYTADTDLCELENPNSPKVVLNLKGQAIYFSRSVIPYVRSANKAEWMKCHVFYKHIGIYAYRAGVLARITEMDQTQLELAESLEQLRWIENGLCIQTAVTDIETCGIDTEADLEKARRIYEESRKYK